MILKLHRKWCKDKYTIGNLYVNNEWFCNTIEDKVRDGGKKVYGETAIPANGKTINGKLAPKTYKVTITYSPKFKCRMPLVNGVPEFTGIRIHSGNDEKDTLGCIIVGLNTIAGRLTNSRDTYRKLMDLLLQAEQLKEEITLIIYY